jgi:formylglycine-generating enzyme required for sulfatase activity
MGNEWGDTPPNDILSVKSFWIDQTEVTNEMFVNFLNVRKDEILINPYDEDNAPLIYKGNKIYYLQCPKCEETLRGGWEPRISWNEIGQAYEVDSRYSNYPVELVEWYGAREYCFAMNRRLPTEAEWEKAASWNDEEKKKYIYPWGNSQLDCSFANYYQNDAECQNSTTVVGSYPTGVSYYGVFDMSGNVWEWVSSLYKSYPYEVDDGREDLDALGNRVVRGGSWAYSEGLRTYDRNQETPGSAVSKAPIGFRCAMDEFE